MFVSCLKILYNCQSLRPIPSFMPKFSKLVFMKSCVSRLLDKLHCNILVLDTHLCPACGQAEMEIIQVLPPIRGSPVNIYQRPIQKIEL